MGRGSGANGAVFGLTVAFLQHCLKVAARLLVSEPETGSNRIADYAGWGLEVVLLATIHRRSWVGCCSLRTSCAQLSAAIAMLAVSTSAGHSQQIFYSSPEPLAATLERYKSGSDPRPTTADGKLQIADWLVSASFGYGGAYDSNVNASSVNKQSVYGANFQPRLLAERNTGIQRTQLYIDGDVRYYPSIGRVDLNGTKAGVIHVWEIQRDLIFRAQTQVAEVQAGSSFNNFLTSGIYATTPVNYTQIFGSSSIQKDFGLVFTAIGGSITATKYRDTTDNLGNTINEQFQNGTVSTLNYRLGYNISPIVYTYVEPSMNWTRYQASNLDSHGYRVVGGIGSGLIGLFSGEVFAGYMKQQFDDPTVADVTSPVVGGKLSWFPTRVLTFTVTADETFGTSDTNALAFTPGSPTKITAVKVSGNWDFSYRYAFTAGFSDQRLNFLNSSRVDDYVAYNAGIIFKLRPGLGLQVGYAHQHLYSNFPGAPYSRDLVTVSGNTQF